MPGARTARRRSRWRAWTRQALALAGGAGCALNLVLAGCSKPPGYHVFVAAGCVRCHGANRAGTPEGPPLKGLRHTWTADQIVEYLADPAAYVQKEPRLQELVKRYKTPMPSFVTLDEPTRRQLAEYLLSTD